jgi:hypothetical protein
MSRSGAEAGACRRPRFLLGTIIVSPLISHQIDMMDDVQRLRDCLGRHQAGDWGLVPAEVAEENCRACDECDDLVSLHRIGDRTVWLLTDAERRLTAVLFEHQDC